MTLEYALKLGLKVHFTNIKSHKIDYSIFKRFEIVLTSFQMKNKLLKIRFFQKPFLLVNFNIKMVLKMSFLTFSNTTSNLLKKNLFKSLILLPRLCQLLSR